MKKKKNINEEKKGNEEIAIARSVITEGNKWLATAISKKD